MFEAKIPLASLSGLTSGHTIWIDPMHNKCSHAKPLLQTALLVLLATTATPGTAQSVLFSDVSTPLTISAPAHVVSLNTANIGALAAGVVVSVSILEGQIVDQGTELVKFDCTGRILDLKQAQLNVRRAEITERAERAAQKRDAELWQRKAISETVYQASVKLFELASVDRGLKEIVRDRAKERVDNCRITAPFRGQVTLVNIGKGSYVATGATVLQLLQIEKLEVISELSMEELEQVQRADKLVFKAGELKVAATIRAVDRVQDSTTGLQIVHLTVKAEARLVAGMQGDLQWTAEFNQLPARFLAQRGGIAGVMTESSTGPVFRPVPGAIDGLPIKVELGPNVRVIAP